MLGYLRLLMAVVAFDGYISSSAESTDLPSTGKSLDTSSKPGCRLTGISVDPITQPDLPSTGMSWGR